MTNISQKEQLIRVGLGSLMIGLGLGRSASLTVTGIFTVLTGAARFCPAKKVLLDNFGITGDGRNFNKSEMGNIPVSDMEDSGGYRTGNPVNGVNSEAFENQGRSI